MVDFICKVLIELRGKQEASLAFAARLNIKQLY